MLVKFKIAIVLSMVMGLSVACRNEAMQNGDERKRFEQRIANLESQNTSLEQQLQSKSKEYAFLQRQSEALNRGELRDPTWDELQSFLLEDKTNEKQYKRNEFDCTGFAIEIRDHARDRGLRAAFVEVSFGDGNTGHALVAFNTPDKGIVYIEPQKDAVAYIKIGEQYGSIGLSALLDTYIDLPADPNAFWSLVRKKKYMGDILAYAYYKEYANRHAFLTASNRARNEDVSKYNAEVKDRILGNWEMNQWYARLDMWHKNLNMLQAELGAFSTFGENLPVSHIEIHWP